MIAVIVLRGFFLEGYLISTGSMAPGLVGFHKRVECPTCGFSFAFGVRFDESAEGTDASAADTDGFATCPNCGQANIRVEPIPVNHGDQLLVHKGVFDFRRPRRWEHVVFSNPANPGEAYVKRVTGLPGESLQILNGDLYIEGQIARKDYAVQRDMRIELFDLNHLSSSDDWQMPWNPSGHWKIIGNRLLCDNRNPGASESDDPQTPSAGPSDNAPAEIGNVGESALVWKYWRVSGGGHVTESALATDAAADDFRSILQEFRRRVLPWTVQLEFDEDRRVMRLRGVMPYQMQQDLMRYSQTDELRHAVYRLAALSHLAPVTDRYGYNSRVASPEFPVTDLMVEAVLHWDETPERIEVSIPVAESVYRLEVHPEGGRVRLRADGESVAVRDAVLPPDLQKSIRERRLLKVEASNFDHRVLAAVNDHPIFAELDLPSAVADRSATTNSSTTDFSTPLVNPAARSSAESGPSPLSRQQFVLRMVGGVVTMESLKMYRDVYYTPGRRLHGVNEPFVVEADSYFVQGDNSPVSSDSRNWETACVPHRLLVGKPFVVHLPSRPGRVSVAGKELPIRIPDFDRVRYIH
ncbi:MAG: hypothetical protein KDA89_07150 [Planctomycetaceae bacterium]|nr:hypothetical protein [Planctomycetaceae bacterium]